MGSPVTVAQDAPIECEYDCEERGRDCDHVGAAPQDAPPDTTATLALPDRLRAMADDAEAALRKSALPYVALLEERIRELEFDVQRREDLERELRRQMRSLERQAERGNEAIEKVRRVERVRCWTNEDRKQFMFADDIRDALGLPS